MECINDWFESTMIDLRTIFCTEITACLCVLKETCRLVEWKIIDVGLILHYSTASHLITVSVSVVVDPSVPHCDLTLVTYVHYCHCVCC